MVKHKMSINTMDSILSKIDLLEKRVKAALVDADKDTPSQWIAVDGKHTLCSKCKTAEVTEEGETLIAPDGEQFNLCSSCADHFLAFLEHSRELESKPNLKDWLAGG